MGIIDLGDNMEQDKLNKNLQRRLSRIYGQIKGIERMIVQGEPCPDILIQIAAVKGAINKVGILIFEEYAQECLHKAADNKCEEEVANLMKLLTSFFR